MIRSTSIRGLFCIALLIVGCAAPSKPPQPTVNFVRQDTAPISNTDACAMRMQDICGDLLLYYAENHHMPEQLDELANVPDIGEVPPFVCPVSHQPYIYDRAGIMLPEQQSRVVLYDATPAHSGMRWGITVSDPQAGKPVIMKVIALREAYFASQQRASTPSAPPREPQLP